MKGQFNSEADFHVATKVGLAPVAPTSETQRVTSPTLDEVKASLHLAKVTMQDFRGELSPAIRADLNARRFIRMLMVLEHVVDALETLAEK